MRLEYLLSRLRASGSRIQGKAKELAELTPWAYHELREACAVTQSLLYEPSLLAELYFPLEQQLSVYMPYWVPVFAPLVKAAAVVMKQTSGTLSA